MLFSVKWAISFVPEKQNARSTESFSKAEEINLSRKKENWMIF